jgi:nucleoside-diphosphate-sugar epimerase
MSAKPALLITGADGFVGRRLVADLREDFDLRALVLPGRSSSVPDGARVIEGEFRALEGLADSVADVEFVIHCVGNMKGRDDEPYFEANALSVEQLLPFLHAHAPRLKRVVLLSSQAAGGPHEGDRPREEGDPARPLSVYGRSKLAGEKAALEWKGRVPVTILRPCSLYGPGDTCFLEMFRLARRGRFGMLFNADKRFQLLEVGDMVAAIRCALGDAGSGEIYFVAPDEDLRYSDLMEVFAKITGKRARPFVLSPRLSSAYLAWCDLKELVTGRADILSSSKAADMREPRWLCSGRKFSERFGFRARVPLAQGFERTYRWYEEHGWI